LRQYQHHLQKNKNRRKNRLQMNGLIVLNKPMGISSAAAVNQVKRLLPRGTKIGHAGTLDPFATGVLLLLVGKATRASMALMSESKGYDATIKLGATTATDDPESPEIPTRNATFPEESAIKAALRELVGQVLQRPPVFSALKIAGQPAYKLARRGKPVELEPRIVRIDSIRVVNWEPPHLKVSIECGKGTYIRSIARDLGEMLKTGGYLTQLCRTHVGQFDLSQAVTLAVLGTDGIEGHLKPVPSSMNAQHTQERGKEDENQG
jgi:tRNA pseudouridine55 synthase